MCGSIKIILIALLISPGLLIAKASDTAPAPVRDTSKYFFYKNYDFGTQAKYNPGDFFINGGFGIWQFSNDRKFFDFPYIAALGNAWTNVLHPMQAIKEFGVKEWLTAEVIPTSLELKHGQYFPNYFLHLLGAGMQFRKMEEWYDYHRFRCPRLWSLATMLCEHYFEEMIELGGERRLSVDAVSDLYIFNPAGILLFLSDGVCRFFSKHFSLNEWSLQPSINFINGQLENMGQFYVAKFPLERTRYNTANDCCLFARSKSDL